MSEWEMVRLGDVCTAKSSSLTQGSLVQNSGDYSVYGASGEITGIDSYQHEIPYIGIVKDGAGVGRVSCLPQKTSVIGTMQALLPNEKINIKYLYYALKRAKLSKYYSGATIPHIYFKDYKSEQIPLPPLEKQQEIAHQLDEITEIIDLRKEQIKKLDLLVKAKFVEMFGDLSTNQFIKKSLPDIVGKDKTSLKRGPFGGSLIKDDFIPEGYLVYEQRHAIHNDFEYEKYYISREKYESMIMFKVNPYDLIVSCSGVTLGRIAEVPQNAKEGIINQALLKITLDKDVMNNTFFVHQFRNAQIQDILFGFSRGSGIPNFPSMSEIKKIKFLVPPLPLQEQFAHYVQTVEEAKKEMEEGLAKMELLYQERMQRWFG